MQTFIQGFRELPFKNCIYLSFGISVLTIVAVVAFTGFLPPEVPLFYGKPVGAGQLTKTLGLTIAPATSLLILALNLFISILATNAFIKKVLIITTCVVSILVAITVVKIFFLVGFF